MNARVRITVDRQNRGAWQWQCPVCTMRYWSYRYDQVLATGFAHAERCGELRRVAA